ncbi:hypothetical protein [Rubellimicrobium roseum]|uniref:DUF3137 domain-containing protein n=1 Tax=Rubellimicrobium roseum TaxID=687525 RepID=A0A5C4NE30_9RHOB|nr:hypothetical protein [Rubellimicrobium roseum]TNC72160.1 hypothetical protein FHG71_08885 [Rubellimicrobium roseum]
MAEPRVLLALLALGLLLVWQARRLSRAAAVRRAMRAGYLDAVLPLLASPAARLEPYGFPRVTGFRGGAPFEVRVVPDTLATRKLPALWLLVTLPEPMPLAWTWHLMLRPRGGETFSAFDRLPRQLAPVPDLPADSAVRTDAAEGTPPGLLAEVVARLGEDRLKEVILSPKGLRLTWLAEEAPRTRYLVFRDAEMGATPFDPSELAPLLEALLDFRAALAPQPERLSA